MEPVTCVIPSYKEPPELLERAVRSAYAAGCMRVMVFDDSINDSRYWLRYDGIPETPIWGDTIHYGTATARNRIIERAITDLIICLDADDTLHDITPLVAAYEPNTWVYGDHNEVNGETVTRHKGAPAGSLARKNITGVTFLFHKEDWQRAGGFDPDFAYAEDYQLQCALTHAGVQPRYVDMVVYDRYLHPEGNERTALAGQYWTFYHQMARRKYPSVFAGTG